VERNGTAAWQRRGGFPLVNQAFREAIELRGRLGIVAPMQTFGKRQYAHIEHDPWAMKKTPRQDKPPRASAIPTSRITGYLIALATVGVLAVAGFEILVLA
jgi:hypothetical protein